MFGIGMPEMILIVAVALIVIGPKKLPELAKSLGRALGEFKRATSDLKDSIQLETGMKDVRDSFDDVKKDIKDSILADEVPGGEPDKKAEAAPDDPMAKVGEAFKAMNEAPAEAPDEPEAAEDTDIKEPPAEEPPKPREKDRS